MSKICLNTLAGIWGFVPALICSEAYWRRSVLIPLRAFGDSYRLRAVSACCMRSTQCLNTLAGIWGFVQKPGCVYGLHLASVLIPLRAFGDSVPMMRQANDGAVMIVLIPLRAFGDSYKNKCSAQVGPIDGLNTLAGIWGFVPSVGRVVIGALTMKS